MRNNGSIAKSLSWRSIPSNIGELGKAELPPDMTIGDAQEFLNTSFKFDGKDFQIGSIQSYKGTIQATSFPSNGNGSGPRTMQVS